MALADLTGFETRVAEVEINRRGTEPDWINFSYAKAVSENFPVRKVCWRHRMRR